MPGPIERVCRKEQIFCLSGSNGNYNVLKGYWLLEVAAMASSSILFCASLALLTTASGTAAILCILIKGLQIVQCLML